MSQLPEFPFGVEVVKGAGDRDNLTLEIECTPGGLDKLLTQANKLKKPSKDKKAEVFDTLVSEGPIKKGAFVVEVVKGYKLQGRIHVAGTPISIENKRGSVRQGKSPDGVPWRTTMLDHYGYFPGVPGVDGDALDVFVGPEARKLKDTQGKEGHFDKVWVIHQKDPKTRKPDEDKVMFGYADKASAISAYRGHYDDPDGFMGPVSEYTLEQFKRLLRGLKGKKKGKRLGVGRTFKG